MTRNTILAFDLAKTTGWAFGAPGITKPLSGSVTFGKLDTSHQEIAAKCIEWAELMLNELTPSVIVYEAPLPPNKMRGHTTLNTTLILMGLPFLVGGLAWQFGIRDIRSATVSSVRTFFIGENCKSAKAEELTLQNCRRLGWNPQSHDEADALALWLYQCSMIDPQIGIDTSPLFFQKIGRASPA